MTNEPRIVERRDGERGIGMLVFFNNKDKERYYRLKESTGKDLDELVSDGLSYFEIINEFTIPKEVAYSRMFGGWVECVNKDNIGPYSSTAPDLIDKDGNEIFILE